MTVSELRTILQECEGDTLVGAEDQDGKICEIQFAGLTSHEVTGNQFFFIRANGGYYLFMETC